MHTTGRNIYVITRPIIERRIFYYSSSRDGKQRKILHFHRKVHTGTGKRIINDPQSSSSIPLLTEYEPICKMVIKLRGSSFVNNLARIEWLVNCTLGPERLLSDIRILEANFHHFKDKNRVDICYENEGKSDEYDNTGYFRLSWLDWMAGRLGGEEQKALGWRKWSSYYMASCLSLGGALEICKVFRGKLFYLMVWKNGQFL